MSTPSDPGASILRNKLVVFFSPGYEGKRFIFERARELGIDSVVIDEPGSWVRALVSEGTVAKLVELEMASKDEDTLFEDALAAIYGLQTDPAVGCRMPDGVTSFCELSVGISARLAEALGLPGAPPSAVEVARNKYATRACMMAAGLATPANALVHDADDLEGALSAVGLPAVLKPIHGAASLGVKKVTTADELPRVFAKVLAEMDDTVVSSGALVPKSSSVESNIDKPSGCSQDPPASPCSGLSGGGGGGFMLEEYLDGCEVDVDVVLGGGQPLYAVVVDNGPTVEPYFNETWGVCPSLLSDAKQEELKDMAVESLRCCGFSAGVFHVELKYTSRGPRLIEINARMGGGQVRDTHLRVHGVDLVEEALRCCLGVPSGVRAGRSPRCSLAYNYVNAPRSGIVEHTKSVEELRALPGVIYAKPLVSRGDYVTGPAEGLPTWLADVMVSKGTPKEALEAVLSLTSALEIPLIDVPAVLETVAGC